MIIELKQAKVPSFGGLVLSQKGFIQALQHGLLCFYFGLPIVCPPLSAPVTVYWWIQNKGVVTVWVQELRTLTEHTGLLQPQLSLFPLQLLTFWDQVVQLVLRECGGEGEEEEQVSSKSISPRGHCRELGKEEGICWHDL